MTNRLDDHRLHSTVLVSPGREKRSDRKLRIASARSLIAADRDEQRARAKETAAVLQSERRSTITLRRGGGPGPAALRTPGRFRLPCHQDTSATLAGAYPFLAEGGLGSEGVFVGQDLYPAETGRGRGRERRGSSEFLGSFWGLGTGVLRSGPIAAPEPETETRWSEPVSRPHQRFLRVELRGLEPLTPWSGSARPATCRSLDSSRSFGF